MPNFTRKAIKQSFWKLLNERPFHKITVKDIVEDCGINRNSFYYHFEDLPSLAEESIEDLIDQAIHRYSAMDSAEAGFQSASSFLLENRDALSHIYNSVDPKILERHLLHICEYAVDQYAKPLLSDLAVSEEKKELLIHYSKCACFGQIMAWLNTGIPDDVLSQFYNFCALGRDIAEKLLSSCPDRQTPPSSNCI